MSNTTTEPMVSEAEARDAVQSMTRRIGLLHLCYARTLVQEMGEERGRKLVEQAIWDYGREIGLKTKANVEALGLDATPENFSKGSDLSPLDFDTKPVTLDGEKRKEIHGCVLAEVWAEYGEEELGSLYCLVDPAKMQAYDPAWTMIHTKKVPDGDPYCETAVRRVKE